MTQIKQGDTVKVHYAGKLNDGTVFDSSEGRDPLEFVVGEGKIIPGFEAAVTGLSVGDKTSAQIASDQAYGPHMEEAVLRVARGQLPPELDPQVGQQLQMQKADGKPIPVRVIEVDEETVTIDANHPLAGKDLNFEIEVVGIN